ncbi:MAG: phosphatase PAP2 family protein [Thermoanaerobaculia bacterium]
MIRAVENPAPDEAAPDRAGTWVRAVLAEHRALLVAVCAYCALAAPLLLGGATGAWHFRFGYRWLLLFWLAASALVLLGARFRGRLAARLRAESVAGALLVLALAAPFQSTFQSLKQAMPRFAPFAWDARLAALDRGMHGGVDPWRLLRPIVRSTVALEVLDVVYTLWFVVLIGAVVAASWSTRRRLRARFLVSTVMAFGLIGTVGAFALSSAGPCYYGTVVRGADPFAELNRTLAAHVDREGVALDAIDNQRVLLEFQTSGKTMTFGGISAMPSMHVAFAVLVALAAGGIDRRWGAVAWTFTALIFLGSVALAWHYAVDGYVAALAAGAIWLWVGRWRSIRLLPELKSIDGAPES